MSDELDLTPDSSPSPESTSFADIAASEMASNPVEDSGVESVDLSISDEIGSTPDMGVAPTQQEAADWRATFREAGLDVTDDADLREVAIALAQARQIAEQVPQLQRLAAIGHQVQPHYTAFQQWQQQQAILAQQQQQYYPPGGQPAPVAQKPAFETPEYDPTWEQLVRKNPETGLLEPISLSVDPSVPQKLQKYYAHQKDVLTKLAANPAEFLETSGIAGTFRQQALDIARKEIQDSIAAQQRQHFISSTIQSHSPWLYQTDQNGNFLTDGQGQRVYSDLGMEYAQALQFVANGDPRDPEYQDTIATLIVQGRRQAQQPQYAPAPVDRKAEFVKPTAAPARRIAGGAQRTPNRIGSAMTGNDDPQNSRQSFKAMLTDAFGLNQEHIEV